jgi:hypothetical protein
VPGRSRQVLRPRLYSVSPVFVPLPLGSQILWEDLLATFSFLSILRPLAACDLLASLRWPCYAGFPGAPTRRCRVRLQRPRTINIIRQSLIRKITRILALKENIDYITFNCSFAIFIKLLLFFYIIFIVFVISFNKINK